MMTSKKKHENYFLIKKMLKRGKKMIEKIKEDIKNIAEDDIKNGAEIEDAINNAIDYLLVYNCDIWEVMQYYQRPTEANIYEAIDCLYNDIYDEIKSGE